MVMVQPVDNMEEIDINKVNGAYIQQEAIRAVVGYNKTHYNKDIPVKNCFIVWSCHILGNKKFLIGIIGDNRYYEVTYNYQKGELYLDVYVKTDNECIKVN